MKTILKTLILSTVIATNTAQAQELVSGEKVECTFHSVAKKEENTFKGKFYPAEQVNEDCRFKAKVGIEVVSPNSYFHSKNGQNDFEIMQATLSDLEGQCLRITTSEGVAEKIMQDIADRGLPNVPTVQQIPLSNGDYAGQKVTATVSVKASLSGPGKNEVEGTVKAERGSKTITKSKNKIKLAFDTKNGGVTLRSVQNRTTRDYAPHYTPSTWVTKSKLSCR